jgi:hypothetical protein
MTFMNKLLTYLGFCPSKESAQGFRVRNNTLTLKRKEYRDAIIRVVVGAIGGTILISIIQRRVAWAFLFTYLIFGIFIRFIHLYLNKRRGAVRAQKPSTEYPTRVTSC